MDLLHHGIQKFPRSQLLSSSRDLGWAGIAAEVRSHPAGEIPAINPDQVEVTIAIAGERDAVVSRKGAGLRQETRVLPGQIWISPVGVVEDDIRITRPLTRILHLYLPTQPAESLSEAFGGVTFKGDSLRYLAGVKDDLIQQIGLSLVAEMSQQTAGGRVLAESLANTLTVRLLQTYSAGGTRGAGHRIPDRWRLDDIRVRRVVEFMMAHLEDDIGLDELAASTNLSPFHFSRMFKATTGVPPHRYLGNLRLERAKELLAGTSLSVAEVAAAAAFSTAANFSRAFKQFTGVTPLEYRNLFQTG
jgi:AraC family transcriptional regulator